MSLVLPKNILSLAEAISVSHSAKKNRKTTVFTNGSFDILHAGHVHYLNQAKELGDILIVGLNSDSSVKGYKGDKRPINNQFDRAYVLASLNAVDFVVIFNESTPEVLISHIHPDIHVKGGDYTIDQLPEAKIVQSYGGKIELLSFIPGKSTTAVIERIREVYP
jgi:D-glycero-beta-D-manno-heptose 1-phosphate adenylyltransferase